MPKYKLVIFCGNSGATNKESQFMNAYSTSITVAGIDGATVNLLQFINVLFIIGIKLKRF